MIYLDHAATTGTDQRVVEFLGRELGRPENASSVHRAGQRARAHLEEAREELAGLLGAAPGEVVFTSGATEANNLAIRGLAGLLRREGRRARIVTSPLEHSCVRETLDRLAAQDSADLTHLPVTPDGHAAVTSESPEADLLCLMYAQNETGVIQDLAAARAWKERTGGTWLCDATQAFGCCDIDLRELGADLLSCSSHKIYGPPGVGALVGPGLKRLEPQITGGPQEGEHRAGTQAVTLIRAFVLAARIAREEREARRAHLSELTRTFHVATAELGLEIWTNGAGAERLPGFLNISIPGISGSDLVIALDARGFAVSSGSACATGVMEVSRAIAAMFPDDPERAAGALRVTPGKDTRPTDMVALAEAIAAVVRRR